MGINSRFFDAHEFRCPCGCGDEQMSRLLVSMLDQARGSAQIPFTVNSGKRCLAHNAAVGGKPNSAHVFGLAVDIACSNSRDRFLIVRALLHCGFTRIGISKTFIHADIDGTKDPEVVWLY